MRLFIIALTILSMCFYGCKNTQKSSHEHETAEEHAAHNHDHEHENHDHEEEEHENGEGHSDEIIFTKAQAAKTDFEVKEIQPGTFHQIIKTTGQVLPEGSMVKQGQPLFYITSKHMGEGDYYTRIHANYEKAKAEYERAEKLVKDQIVSQKEFENARLNYQNAKTAYEAISGKQSAKGVGITTPLTGYLKNISVKDGEYVTAGQAIATVSQNKKLVLRADVSEKYYNSLNSINNANFKTPYDNRVYALPDLSGKLLSVGKAAGTNSFFIPVTFEFDNRGDIIPGSFVEIYLLSYPMENVLSLPVSALTNEMGNFYVYRQLDEEGYQKQEVTLGANNGKEVQVLSGLTPGDRIVTRGAYQVKMASASAAIPGHTHEH